ncbi:MAG: CRTAC1 family protein, partial [Planctomycetia bacterium]
MSPRAEDPLPAQEDEVPADDRVIGRAFRLSLLALVVLAAGGVGLWWALRPPPPPPAQQAQPVAAPVVREKALAAPDLPFKDITAEAGIAWRHVTGGTGHKWLPETMGPGCAFLDLEDDGDPDLLLVNGCAWPGEPLPAGSPPARHALYR